MNDTKKRSRLKIVLIIIVSLIIVLAGAFLIYTADYYRAQSEALTIVENDPDVIVFDGGIAFGNPSVGNGFIFYPGAKVEYTAYAPLMKSLSEHDILCVIVKMPFNLAVLNGNAAAGIIDHFPEVRHWTIGGHSLGGVMAADFAFNNADQISKLVLLASYPATDLSQSKLSVLSIYGSQDHVLNVSKLEEAKVLMSADFTELIIAGGNHGQFGDYGLQAGDGTATISVKQQLDQTVEAIVDFVQK